MNKLNIARIVFVCFSLIITFLILSKTLTVPVAMGLWVVGMVIFTRARKRNKKEND